MNKDVPCDEVRVVVIAESAGEERGARLAIESLRAFGGAMRGCPVWAFGRHSESLAMEGVRALPLETHDRLRGYPFTAKVTACARAEERARSDGAALAFLSAACLVVAPPILLRLAAPHRAALRPVHIRNVGSLAAESVDAFWQAIYARTGEPDPSFTVESLVDGKTLRPYFNTHLFSIDPAEGLLQRWLEHFTAMATDDGFQSGPCGDAERRVFLHQAILSALVASSLGRHMIRILPGEYSYPLHLHTDVPPDARAESLEDLVCPVYEGSYSHPATLAGIRVGRNLGSWLLERSAV